ncbi:MAG: DUF2937 family protein [Sulfitobacter sp.]
MILRAMALAGGVAAGAGLSQFPEFSQQYAQRLGGAVDALSQVVADFDASAAAEGLTRQAALQQMTGTDFVERRRTDMETTFHRYDTLRDDLAVLKTSGPFMRAYHAARMTDGQIASRAWAAFQPAVPLSFAGVIFAGSGFVMGYALIGVLLSVAGMPFRRTKPKPPPNAA